MPDAELASDVHRQVPVQRELLVDVDNVIDTPFSGAQHGVGVAAYADDAMPHAIALTQVTVNDFQKNGVTIDGQPAAPAGSRARNPAFDVTPHALITALVTEAGVHRPPFEAALRRATEEGMFA